MRILNRSLPIFIRSSSLCCVARQTCRIIGNEKNNNTIFEKCGTSADFAGHLMKMRDCPSECGTVDTYVIVSYNHSWHMSLLADGKVAFVIYCLCFSTSCRSTNVVSVIPYLCFPVLTHATGSLFDVLHKRQLDVLVSTNSSFCLSSSTTLVKLLQHNNVPTMFRR